MNNATLLEGSSVILGEQDTVLYSMVMIKRQTLKKLNGMMMMMEVTEIIQKLKMIPQIHPSNLPGNA
jgi:hypothetical protein